LAFLLLLLAVNQEKQLIYVFLSPTLHHGSPKGPFMQSFQTQSWVMASVKPPGLAEIPRVVKSETILH